MNTKNNHRSAFMQRLAGGVIWGTVLYFALSFLGKWLLHGNTALRFIGVLVVFASFYLPWKWFKWNLTDFIRQERYTKMDYKINRPNEHYLHRATDISSYMWLLTIPFIILSCFLTLHITRTAQAGAPNNSNVIEASQLNDGRFKQSIIDGCKKSPGGTDASCGCIYGAMLSYFGDVNGIAKAMGDVVGKDGKFDNNKFYTPGLVSIMNAQCTTN